MKGDALKNAEGDVFPQTLVQHLCRQPLNAPHNLAGSVDYVCQELVYRQRPLTLRLL